MDEKFIAQASIVAVITGAIAYALKKFFGLGALEARLEAVERGQIKLAEHFDSRLDRLEERLNDFIGTFAERGIDSRPAYRTGSRSP